MHADNVENLAIQRYKNNLLYFEKYQPNVYAKLASFDMALEQNHYQQRYDLILKSDYFDVLELSSGQYLYATDSNAYAKLAAQSINFKNNSNVYETFRKIKIREADLDKYEKIDIQENNLSGLAGILDYIDKNKTLSCDLSSIKKFIFFGVGLGQHIVEIDKKIGAEVYFIIEDDLELFKLSLFTLPYYELAQKSELIVSVFDTKQEFSALSEIFLQKKFYYNHYIKYFHMLSHSEEKLEEFHIKIASQSHNLFLYNAILQQYLRPISYLRENFNFLNILQPYAPLETKPILLLAAGPSLEKNMKWLKENQHKFIIVALSATLNILEKNSIVPSVVTHIDGFDDAIEHFAKISSMKFLKNTIFLISARTPKEIISFLDKKNIFFFENGTSYKQTMGNLSAPCVGSTTYLLLLALGVKQLYLLGLDLALDSTTGNTHADGHFESEKLDLNAPLTHKDTIKFRDHLIKITGNLQKSVYTLPAWKSSIESINEVSNGFKKENQIVYNLSDGAAFSNTVSQPIHAINMQLFEDINQKSVSHELLHIFSANSASSLSDTELLLMKERFQYAQELQATIKKQQNRSFTSHNEFLASLVLLLNQCTSNTSTIAYDLSLVYQEYFRFIYTFIFDFFNSDTLTDKELHANHINALLCVQLLRIVDVYIKDLSFTQ